MIGTFTYSKKRKYHYDTHREGNIPKEIQLDSEVEIKEIYSEAPSVSQSESTSI